MWNHTFKCAFVDVKLLERNNPSPSRREKNVDFFFVRHGRVLISKIYTSWQAEGSPIMWGTQTAKKKFCLLCDFVQKLAFHSCDGNTNKRLAGAASRWSVETSHSSLVDNENDEQRWQFLEELCVLQSAIKAGINPRRGDIDQFRRKTRTKTWVEQERATKGTSRTEGRTSSRWVPLFVCGGGYLVS